MTALGEKCPCYMYIVTSMLDYVLFLVLRGLHITSRQFQHFLFQYKKNKAIVQS
jgi:hypothetical protein